MEQNPLDARLELGITINIFLTFKFYIIHIIFSKANKKVVCLEIIMQ